MAYCEAPGILTLWARTMGVSWRWFWPIGVSANGVCLSFPAVLKRNMINHQIWQFCIHIICEYGFLFYIWFMVWMHGNGVMRDIIIGVKKIQSLSCDSVPHHGPADGGGMPQLQAMGVPCRTRARTWSRLCCLACAPTLAMSSLAYARWIRPLRSDISFNCAVHGAGANWFHLVTR